MRFLDSPRERAQSLVLALALVILLAVAPFATGLLGGVVLQVMFAPVHARLTRYMPMRPAAGLVTLAAASLLLLPAVLLLLLAIDRAPSVIEELRRSSLFDRVAAIHVGAISIGAEIERGAAPSCRRSRGGACSFLAARRTRRCSS